MKESSAPWLMKGSRVNSLMKTGSWPSQQQGVRPFIRLLTLRPFIRVYVLPLGCGSGASSHYGVLIRNTRPFIRVYVLSLVS